MIAYLDTSALMKLLIEEDGSAVVRQVWDAADVVLTSRVSYPEARAALARGRCGGRLTDGVHTAAKARLGSRIEQTRVVDLTSRIARRAGDLAERHRLRGCDAIHLASAEAASDPELLVATWDSDLLRAAQELGLATVGAT